MIQFYISKFNRYVLFKINYLNISFVKNYYLLCKILFLCKIKLKNISYTICIEKQLR